MFSTALSLPLLVFLFLTVIGEGIAKCPDPYTIHPCICNHEVNLILDCSEVTSEDELIHALQADFPSKDFYLFGIYNNNHLKVIPNDIFGDLTFQTIEIKVGYLDEIQPGAFLGSSSTLQWINVFNNEIWSFPFEELGQYEQLMGLEMTYNNISFLPKITSSSLQTLDMSKNPLGNIAPDSLQGMPSLANAIFESCEISEVFSGTFIGLPQLTFVALFSNNLTSIPANAIELHGEGSYVYLGINHIKEIEAGAFKGISRVFDIDHNSLSTLEEDLWRPVLETGAGMYLVGNPLECGCDIKWLIQEPKFMKQLDPYAACANGTLLSDLPVSSFDAC